jgi:hypothetical protein
MSEKRITQEQIKEVLSRAIVNNVKLGVKTTLVYAVLESGFVIVESSSCVDPENYDHELGKKICMKRIEDKLWELEGYAFQKKLSGE